MKIGRLALIGTILAGFTSLYSEEPASGAKDIATSTFLISGMHCQPCADAIKTALSKEKGVEKAEVQFSEKKALVSYHTSEVTPDQIIATVKAAGYDSKKE